jgi:hypothetical protein
MQYTPYPAHYTPLTKCVISEEQHTVHTIPCTLHTTNEVCYQRGAAYSTHHTLHTTHH